jgi:hypothetical protein
MLYLTYQFAMWPLGTFLAGVEGIGLVWPTIGAVPIFAVGSFIDRKRQERALKKASALVMRPMMNLLGRKVQIDADTTVTRANSALGIGAAVVVPMLVLYYAGSAITYLWT